MGWMKTYCATLVSAVSLLVGCGDSTHKPPENTVPPGGLQFCKPANVDTSSTTALAIAGEDIFIAAGGKIVRISKGCAEGKTIAEAQQDVIDIEVRDGKVYWLASDKLMVVDAEGGTPAELTWHPQPKGSPRAQALATDGTHVYVVADKRLARVQLGGGGLELLHTPACGASGLALNADHVYVSHATCAGDIRRMAKTGDKATTVSVSQHSSSVAVNGSHVVWITREGQITTLETAGGSLDANISRDVIEVIRRQFMKLRVLAKINSHPNQCPIASRRVRALQEFY